jgi:hypothetical protein
MGTMKAAFLTLTAAAALVVVPTAFGGKLWYAQIGQPTSTQKAAKVDSGTRGTWHKVRDGNAWVHSAGSSRQGITIITDTLGGNGGAPKAVADPYQTYSAQTEDVPANAPVQPYLYGGAPKSVADSYQAYIGQTNNAQQVASTPDALARYLGNANDGSISTAASQGSGFSWADAGIGAVTALVALLLLMSVTTLTGGRRSRRLAL